MPNAPSRRERNSQLAKDRDAAPTEEARLAYRNTLVEENLALVHHFTHKRYSWCAPEVKQELISEAYIVLIETCDKWNPELGALGSYLFPRLRRRFTRVLDSVDKPLQVPERVGKNIRKGVSLPVYTVSYDDAFPEEKYNPENISILREHSKLH